MNPSALPGLSNLAQAAEAEFSSHYNNLLPGLLAMYRDARAPELARLRGRALTCLSLIGKAVGPSVFSRDATVLMNEILLPEIHRAVR